MRPLHELINDNEPAWPLVEQWIGEAVVPVEVLPADRAAGEAALYATQVTTRSPMGAIASRSTPRAIRTTIQPWRNLPAP